MAISSYILSSYISKWPGRKFVSKIKYFQAITVYILKMILIADSGSTKTHWELVDVETRSTQSFFTPGINPFYQSTQEIQNTLTEELPALSDEKLPTHIYFYGAGCSQPDKKKSVSDAILQLFPNAVVEIQHDLIAAARATCGHDEGIACILGTGSNSCLFDGKKIIDNIPSLGFLLGDEGSAGWFGRKLLQAYFYRELSIDLHSAIENEFDLTKAEVVNRVHHDDYPNRYVASFAKFISQHQQHTYMRELLLMGFNEFIERHVMKYEDHERLPIHFIGSMAYNNQEILLEVIGEKHLQAGRFMQEPMEQLVQYHVKQQG